MFPLHRPRHRHLNQMASNQETEPLLLRLLQEVIQTVHVYRRHRRHHDAAQRRSLRQLGDLVKVRHPLSTENRHLRASLLRLNLLETDLPCHLHCQMPANLRMLSEVQ